MSKPSAAWIDENGCYWPRTGRWCFSCNLPLWRTDGATEYHPGCDPQAVAYPVSVRKEM